MIRLNINEVNEAIAEGLELQSVSLDTIIINGHRYNLWGQPVTFEVIDIIEKEEKEE